MSTGDTILLCVRRGLLGEDGREVLRAEPRAGLTPRALAREVRSRLPRSIPIEVWIDGRDCEDADLDRDLRGGQVVVLAPITSEGIEWGALIVQAIVAAAISFAVSYLISVLSPRPRPQGEPQQRGDQTSPTYAWDQIQTNYGQGFPVPFVYGRHAVGGQVIYTDVQATTDAGVVDDQLSMVLALSEGPIARIGDVDAAELDNLGGLAGNVPGPPLPDHLYVNGNLLQSTATADPVTNVLLATPWSASRPANPGESIEVLNGSASVGLLQVVDVRNSPATDLDCVIVSGGVSPGNTLKYDQGVVVSTATVASASTVARVNPRPGARVWIRPGTLDQSPMPAPFGGSATSFAPGNQLNEQGAEAIYTFSAAEEIRTVGFVFSFPAGLYALDPLGNLLSYPVRFDVSWRPQGTTSWRAFYRPATTQVLTYRIVGTQPRVGVVLDSFGGDLARSGDPSVFGPIEVRVVRRSPSGSSGTVSSCVWRNVFFATSHQLGYPRVALLGLRLNAGARFAGGLPQFNIRVDGIKVRVWDAAHGFSAPTWDVPSAPFNFMTYPPGRNPAWILLDFLTQPWGLGAWLTDADLDLPSFRRWAAFCDQDPSPSDPWGEAAFCCDLVGDSPKPAWEWVLTICAAGRASPVWRNGKIGVVYQYRDAHADAGVSVPAKQPVQLLTAGNTEELQVTWLPKATRATVLMFQFLNETQLYAQDVLPVEDDESELNDPSSLRPDKWRPEPIQAYGVTRPSQLYREGKFRHRANRLIRRQVQLRTGRWALAAEVGDLVDVEHEILRPFGSDVPVNMTVLVGGMATVTITVDHEAAGATQIVVRDPEGKPQRRDLSSPVVIDGTTTFALSAAVDCAAGATCVVGLADKLVETYEVVSISLQKDMRREVLAVQWVHEVHDPVTPDEFEGAGTDAGVDTPGGLPSQASQFDEPEVEAVTVVADRGGAHRIVFAKPRSRLSSHARVYVRDTDLDVWLLAGETATEEIEWRHFVPWRSYDVSVCLQALNDSFPPPDAGTIVRYTAEEFPPFAPPQVTNLRASQLDDLLLVEWDDLDVLDLDHYEVRLGTHWSAAAVLARTRAPLLLLSNPPGGGTLLVAAHSRTGLFGRIATVALASWSPPLLAAVATVDELSGTPTGTHDGTQWSASDGVLELQAGEVGGSYTAAVVDCGYQAPFFWQVVVDRAEYEDATVDDLAFAIDSGEARWRTVDGRPASPAKPGVDWQTTIDDLAMTIDDLPSDLLVHGHVGETGSHTRVAIESRFEFGGVWGDWSPHHDRTVVARKMQVRALFNRSSERYRVHLQQMTFAAYL